MYPPIFLLCKQSAGLTAVLGSNPTRVYPFGEAPQDVAKPYAVWQTISGSPENCLSNTPKIDEFLIQIDVYSDNASQSRQAAELIRDAVERDAHITAWRGESRDPDTNNYRLSFDIQFLTPR